MDSTIGIRARHFTLLFVLAANIVSGCGEAGMFSTGELRAMSSSNMGADVDEARVTVTRVSPRCDAAAATACPEAAAPALEIHFEGHSVILDFSNVEEAGTFDMAEFDGFEIEFSGTAEDGPLYFVTVDADQTSIDVDDETLDYQRNYLDINLAGLDYDSETFIKIDLLLGPLNLFARSGS